MAEESDARELFEASELEEARAFNNWLGERRQAQEGQRHLDDVSRLTEAVHRQVPQLRYARAERRGVERMYICRYENVEFVEQKHISSFFCHQHALRQLPSVAKKTC